MLDRERVKRVGLEHPLRKQSFFATLENHSKMGLPVVVLLAKDNGSLSVERMIRIAHLEPKMMGSMRGLRSQGPPRCLPTSRATPTVSRSPMSRLIAYDERSVTFKWKDYRAKASRRYKTLRLTPEAFIRRFLIHVLPQGVHRIRHYGLLANGIRAQNLAKARALLGVVSTPESTDSKTAAPDAAAPTFSCPTCGQVMRIIETFAPDYQPPAPLHRGGDPP